MVGPLTGLRQVVAANNHRKGNTVSKSTVTRIFFGSLITVAAGAVIALIAVGLAYANNVFVTNGSTVVDVWPSPLAFALLGLGIVGALAMIAGVIAGFVAWIGALLNTSQLQSKAWFLALLLLGIFNLGFIAMIAYVVAGPDGTRPITPPPAATAAPSPA
jgi:hypothetical protein